MRMNLFSLSCLNFVVFYTMIFLIYIGERVEIAVIIPVSLVVIVVIVHIIITLFIIIFYRRKQKFRVPFNDRSHVSQNCSVRQSVIEIDVNLGPDETEYEDSKKNSEAIDV